MAANFEITCPCCDTLLIVDRLSGEVLLHKVKEKANKESFDAMVSKLEEQKSEAAKRFDRQLDAQKDRARILEERFKEAMQRAEKDETPHVNPMDMD
jgi:sulfate adenylyltransferase subunit 1 (EFTu-like GTPase family)